MVRQDGEVTTLDVIAEVLYGAVGCKKFTSNGTVMGFTGMKLFREKCKGLPLAINQLLP